MKPRVLVELGALILAGLHTACGWAPEMDGELRSPDRGTFPLVADALERRCSTLDCHGRPERNLRLYSGPGLRLAPGDVPGSGATTEAEYGASFESVVGLEPEVMSLVVAERGKAPERLTLVRKARGSESHKGGAVIVLGDESDQCLTSWLSSSANEEACAKAREIMSPW